MNVLRLGPCGVAMTLPSGPIAGSRSGREGLVSAAVAPGGGSSPALRPQPARPSAATSAPTAAIRRGIAAVFDQCDVETIAPGYGCILHGRKVVARHVEMLDEVLAGLDKSVAVSRYVGRDEER